MKILPVNFKYMTHFGKLNTEHKTTKSQNLKNDVFEKSKAYKDEDIREDDGWVIFGFDGYDMSDCKNRMRYRLFNGTKEGDILMKKDTCLIEIPIQNETYIHLSDSYTSPSGKVITPFENIQDAPDLNGVRGKFPLPNRNIKNPNAAGRKLDTLKNNSIYTIIDLRDKDTCQQGIKDRIEDVDIIYFNFPVEELASGQYDEKFLDKITQFFDIINMGGFYIGCANGESRTDLALGINYVCNKKAQNTPRLNWLHTGNNDMHLKTNIAKINKLVANNPEIVKDWGWQDYEEYMEETARRLNKAYQCNKNNKK